MVYFFKILQRCAHIYLWILLFCYSCSRARESERYKTRSKYTTHHITIRESRISTYSTSHNNKIKVKKSTHLARGTDWQTRRRIYYNFFWSSKKIARSYISTILLNFFGFAQDLPSQLMILLFSTRHNSLSNSTVDTYSTLLIVACRRN